MARANPILQSLGLLGLLTLATTPPAHAVELAFPSPNRALLQNDGPAFYQYVDRSFEGEPSHPWEGGQYGYVRNPIDTGHGIQYVRFHEGIDIRPLSRDARGEPIDPVFAVDEGTVVHASNGPRDSNYGRYIVIEHVWDRAPYYTLYAHLAKLTTESGTHVQRGQQIATIGYSGTGITKERAHLHFEINLLLNSHFEQWHHFHFATEPNRHGIYNGLNLLGIDPARVLLATTRNPNTEIPALIRTDPAFFRVLIPNSPDFELIRRYPWLNPEPQSPAPASWEITFNPIGIPLRAKPSQQTGNPPTLLDAQPSPFSYPSVTRGLLSGTATNPRLTETGQRFLQLLTMPPHPPAPAPAPNRNSPCPPPVLQ